LAGNGVHCPVAGSQLEPSWQASGAGQVLTAAPAMQAPAWQESPCVQPFPSSQEVPSGEMPRQFPVA
jgi:hypothetical protein